jgi:hypothetical protein
LLGLDSLFQKTLIIIPEKRNVQSGDAFEDTAFKQGFEIVTFQARLSSLSSSVLCDNRFHQWISDIELDQMSDFFSFLFQD